MFGRLCGTPRASDHPIPVKLQRAKAIILGVFKDCDFNNDDINKDNSLSLHEVIVDRLKFLDIPIITNFPCGHGKYQATLPISIPAELDASTESPTLTILESPVS